MADETLVEDAKDPEPQEGSPPPEEPKAEEVEGEAPKAAEETPKKKRGRRKKGDAAGDTPKKEGTPRVRKKKEPAEPATPVERPSRERKTVERFSALTPQKSAAKALSIEQGPGTKLKDIPNVLFKLNKRKVDDNLQHLHTVLFSKRAKVHHIKKNIFQFSGFVWTDNKEKSRAKVREKLDKYNKDRLLDFCETLDIPVNKAGTKKEDVAAKLLEFLESPHVTRDVVIADKEQRTKKRKRTRKGSKGESGEKRKRGRKPSVRSDNNDVEEMEVEGDSAGEEEKEEDAPQQDDIVNSGPEDAEAEEKSSDDDEDEPESPAEKKASVVKKGSQSKNNEKETLKKSSDSKSVKIPSSHEESEGKKGAKRGRKPAVKASGEDKPDLKISAKKGASAAKGEDGKNKNEKSPKEKHDDKRVSKASSKTTKEKGKAKSSSKDFATPTREEMHAVVSEILKEVDFNTATLADILKQLGAHFKKDLMDRKAEVKSIIEDVINSMSDDGDGDEDEEGDGDEEKGNADRSSGEGDA